MSKIIVDGESYPSKEKASQFFLSAIGGTDGSERERMAFAYYCIQKGCTKIDTYNETAY